ncbi:MAG TPA: signal peptide peptidase SppA [bacterium]|nr:signal peptide peptidase SppA [bacterium]
MITSSADNRLQEQTALRAAATERPGSLWNNLGKVYLYVTSAIGSCGCIAAIGLIMLIVWGARQIDSVSDSFGPAETEEVLVAGEAESEDVILVVPISGEIVEGEGSSPWDSDSYAVADAIIEELDQAMEDEQVKAVILDVNSPGGGSYPSVRIYDKVTEFAAQKPVVAYFSQVAASGGYYVSLPAERIVAHPETLTGSIGVILSVSNIEGLADKIGLAETVFKSGEHKDIGNSLRAVSEEESAIFQSIVDESFAEFRSQVLEHRSGIQEADQAVVFDGRVFTGQQALQYGLVDQLGDFEDAVTQTKEIAGLSSARVIRYEQHGFWDTVFSGSTQLQVSVAGVDISARPAESRSYLLYLWEGAL